MLVLLHKMYICSNIIQFVANIISVIKIIVTLTQQGVAYLLNDLEH